MSKILSQVQTKGGVKGYIDGYVTINHKVHAILVVQERASSILIQVPISEIII